LSLKQADAILPLCLAQHSIVADNGRAANDGQLGTPLACAALEGLESPNCVSAVGPSSAVVSTIWLKLLSSRRSADSDTVGLWRSKLDNDRAYQLGSLVRHHCLGSIPDQIGRCIALLLS